MQSEAISNVFPSALSLMPSQGRIVWLYGLSGAGKSTIAQRTQDILKRYKKRCFILDGDDLRSGLNSDLGFTEEDREENLRRAAETAILLSRTCDVVICTFITPKHEYRSLIDNILKEHPYQIACVNTPLSECENRDTKGLYRKARKGEIRHFTGISSPYDFPEKNTICIDTLNVSVEQSARALIDQCKLDL